MFRNTTSYSLLFPVRAFILYLPSYLSSEFGWCFLTIICFCFVRVIVYNCAQSDFLIMKRFVRINDDSCRGYFCDNRISNTKYTLVNFLPMNLREQFRFVLIQYMPLDLDTNKCTINLFGQKPSHLGFLFFLSMAPFGTYIAFLIVS